MKRWLRDGAILLAIAIALLAGVEVLLRLVAPEPRKAQLARWGLVPHPTTLVRLAPGIERIFEAPWPDRESVRWRVNADGFRGPELRDDAALRVIVYGDSNVLARFSPDERTFPRILESELTRALDQPVEVVNAGTLGFGPDQNWIRLQEEYDRVRPDFIVFHVFADNDLGDLIRNQLFDVDLSGRLVPRPPVTPSWRQRLADLRLLSWIRERFAAPEPAVKTRVGIPERMARHDREYALYRSGSGATSGSDHFDVDVAIRPRSASARTKWALFKALMGELGEWSQRRPGKVLVVVQPSARDLTENVPLNHTDFEAFPIYDPLAMSRGMTRLANGAGLATLDLTPVFLGNQPATLYWPQGDHWNDAGQALAAEAVAARVAQELRSRPH